jgi:hypothetical protein
MDFFRRVETDLRDLAAEARRLMEDTRHPLSASATSLLASIKTSCENGVVQLRMRRVQHAKEVRESNAADAPASPSRSSHPQQATGSPGKASQPGSSELVQPFILGLAASLPPNLVSIALSGINFLLSSHAVPAEYTPQLATVLTAVATCPPLDPKASIFALSGGNGNASSTTAPEMLQLKAMQTAILLMNSLQFKDMDESTVASLVNIPGRLLAQSAPQAKDKAKKDKAKQQAQSSAVNMVASAANATLSQLISLLFDRAATDRAQAAADTNADTAASTTSSGVTSSILVFESLCELAETIVPAQPLTADGAGNAMSTAPPVTTIAEAFAAIKTHPAMRPMAFSILDLLLSSSPALFALPQPAGDGDELQQQAFSASASANTFSDLLRYKICPLLTTTLLSEYGADEGTTDNFALMVKLMALSKTLLVNYGGAQLAGECHILLTTLCGFVSANTTILKQSAASEYVFSDDESKLLESRLASGNAFGTNGRDGNKKSDSNAAAAAGASASNSSNPNQHSEPPASLLSAAQSQLKSPPEEEPLPAPPTPTATSASPAPTIPVALMWRCALSLEILYDVMSSTHLVSSLHASFSRTRPNNTIISNIAQTVTDYISATTTAERATIEVVLVAKSNYKKTYAPRMFQLASRTVDSSSTWSSSASSSHSPTIPPCEEGETIYLGISTIMNLIQTVHKFNQAQLLISTFPQLHDALIHILKHFPGCSPLMFVALPSFENLASSAIQLHDTLETLRETIEAPDAPTVPFQRQILLSLSKLSLPAFPGTMLTDFHTKALTTLFSLTHTLANRLREDWGIVLSTFEQLAELPIASRKLSDDAYDIAIALSAAFSLLTEYSGTLEDESLVFFMDALANLKGAEKRPVSKAPPLENQLMASNDDVAENGDNTLGMRLMSIASKTIQNLTRTDVSDTFSRVKSRLHPQRVFGDDLRSRIFSRNDDAAAAPPGLSFGLVSLIDVAKMNNWRKNCDATKLVSRYLCEVGKQDPDERIRAFAVDALSKMIMLDLEEAPKQATNPGICMRQAKGIEDLFRVKKQAVGNVDVGDDEKETSNADLFGPLMECITSSSFASTKEAGLLALHKILESMGQLVNDAWPLVIDTITSCADSALAFQCLQFIVDDFLETLAENEIVCLLKCCSAFGASDKNINTSLSAVGMIWKISDQSSMGMWKVVLGILIEQAHDPRNEVRNCAVNTLFSCIAGNGSKFELGSKVGSPRKKRGGSVAGEDGGWSYVFTDVVFVLLNKLDENYRNASSSSGGGGGGGSNIMMHHSRDNPKKQWAETLKIGLQGMSRVLRQYMPLFRGRDWFEVVWRDIGAVGRRCVVCEEGEVASAGVELLLLCVELSSKNGEGRTAGLRAGDNMKVVNGRLQNVDGVGFDEVVRGTFADGSEDEDEYEDGRGSAEARALRHSLFLTAFKNVEMVPSLVEGAGREEDILASLSDGVGHVYLCCSAFEMAAKETHGNKDVWVLNNLIELIHAIVLRCSALSSSKYTTPAQKNMLQLLKDISTGGSSLAFEVLAKLGGGGGGGSQGALQAEAARGVSEAYGSVGVSEAAKIAALPRVLGFDAEGGMGKDQEILLSRMSRAGSLANGTEKSGSSWRFGRQADLASYGEGLLPVLKGGLTALVSREKERVARELQYEDGEKDGDGAREAANIWKGVLASVLTFLSPSVIEVRGEAEPAGSISPKSKQIQSGFGNNDAVVDTALAILSCAMSTCPDEEWRNLANVLTLAAKRCMKAAKWYSAEGLRENAEAELRIFSGVVNSMCGGCVGQKEGGKQGMVELCDFVLGRVAKGGKVLRKLGTGKEESLDGGWISRLTSLSQRRESIEREVMRNGGGSFGLDDSEVEESEVEGEGEEDKRRKAAAAHDFDCWCGNILCEELSNMWVEGSDNREVVRVYAELCGNLIGCVCVCESTGLKERVNVLISRVDLGGLVKQAQRAEGLERRVEELEREVKKLEAQSWSLSSQF